MEFDLYGDIGGEDQKLSSAATRTFLKGAPDAKSLTVRIKSSGGDVLEGMSIYNMLAGHPGKKTVIVDGLAASIASLIAMAGDEIQMIEGSFMMIHNPYAVTKGESSDLRRTADVLDKMASSMVAVYADRTKLPEDEILKMMNAETWMSAKEAVAKGFADKIIKNKSEIKALQEAGAFAQLKTFANVPEELRKFVSSNPEGETIIKSQEESNEMADSVKAEAEPGKLEEVKPDFAKKFAELEEKVNSLAKFLQDKKAEMDEECEASDDEEPEGDEDESDADHDEPDGDEPEEEEEMDMKDKKDAKTVAKSNKHMVALAEATKLVAQLTEKLEAVEKGKFEARVAEAIKAGQLLPSQKAWALALGSEDFDAYIEAMGDVRFPLGKEHKEDVKAASELAGQTELTKEEKTLARGMGFSDEEILAYNKKNPLKK